jgi:hypothetical protein
MLAHTQALTCITHFAYIAVINAAALCQHLLIHSSAAEQHTQLLHACVAAWHCSWKFPKAMIRKVAEANNSNPLAERHIAPEHIDFMCRLAER